MRAVQQPELALLEGSDIIHEPGTGVFPGRAARDEPAGEHPFAEGLGDHWRRVVPAGTPHQLDVGVGAAWRDAVDDARHERDVMIDPRRQRRIDGLGQLGHDATRHGAVGGQVVAGHDGDRPRAGGAPRVQPGDQPRRGGADRGTEVGLQRRDVGSDRGVGAVEATVRRPAVPGLGHGERDEHDLGVGQLPQVGIVIGSGVHRRQRGHDLQVVAVRRARDQRVQAVLRGEDVGDIAAATGEGRDPPLAGVR